MKKVYALSVRFMPGCQSGTGGVSRALRLATVDSTRMRVASHPHPPKAEQNAPQLNGVRNECSRVRAPTTPGRRSYA